MALTLTQLQANRDALIAALGNPIARVRFADGREQEFKGTADIQRAITQIDSEILKASGGGGNRTTYGQHSRGTTPTLGWPNPGSFD